MKAYESAAKPKSRTSGGLLKFSVALPEELVEELDRIRVPERRTRNNMLTRVLELGLKLHQIQTNGSERVA